MIVNYKDIEELYLKDKSKKGYKSIYQIVVKRIIDIILCTLAFPIVLLIFIPIAIAIKIEDQGPILYQSMRIGKGFIEFPMYKFRSMKVDSPDIRNEDGSTYNSDNDPRVTRVGRFLRETSLDELPQIINVLLGQMSIVGPRAGDVESKDTYTELEKDKLLLRPGITGYTQAYFRNGLGVKEKRLYDAWYAHAVTFVLDIRILFRTIKTVLLHENIYSN